MTEQAHTKLLTQAGRAILSPIGLVQKGRSRTWLDDNGWWLCVVEFQPSSWSKGSYLNVGCMWLWRKQDSLSFDEGYRVENFAGFEDTEQFTAIATTLAERALKEVKRYRSLFPTVRTVSDHYLKKEPVDFWASFNAAVACGIAGRPSPARKFFKHVLDSKDGYDWVLSAQEEAAHLNAHVGNSKVFRQIIAETVVQTRQSLKLPKRDIVGFEKSP